MVYDDIVVNSKEKPTNLTKWVAQEANEAVKKNVKDTSWSAPIPFPLVCPL